MTTIYGYPGADNPDTYEWENRIADPEQRIEAFIGSVVPLPGATIVDVGSGSGFHAARYAGVAAHVYAVEPAIGMLGQALSRFAGSPQANVSLIAAGADDLPLKDGLADIVHSRFAYFFGPETKHVRSCEPGIHEALRVLKPDGAFFVVDNSLVEGEFAGILERHGYSAPSAETMQSAKDAFWVDQGFQKQTVVSAWDAPSREVLHQVIAMEFRADTVDAIMDEISGTSLSYVYDVYWRRK